MKSYNVSATVSIGIFYLLLRRMRRLQPKVQKAPIPGVLGAGCGWVGAGCGKGSRSKGKE